MQSAFDTLQYFQNKLSAEKRIYTIAEISAACIKKLIVVIHARNSAEYLKQTLSKIGPSFCRGGCMHAQQKRKWSIQYH